jgi:hypothetical protein
MDNIYSKNLKIDKNNIEKASKRVQKKIRLDVNTNDRVKKVVSLIKGYSKIRDLSESQFVEITVKICLNALENINYENISSEADIEKAIKSYFHLKR